MVCLSYGEKSGKGAGLTLNFAVRDVKDFLKINKLVNKYNQSVDFGVKASKYELMVSRVINDTFRKQIWNKNFNRIC